VGFGEVCFEVRPVFVGRWEASPFLASFWEEVGVENEGVGVSYDFGVGVRTATSICKIHVIFYLRIESFNGLGGLVGCANVLVVKGKAGWGDVSVRVEKMSNELSQGDVGEACVAVLERT
jgi:hypothetical protein